MVLSTQQPSPAETRLKRAGTPKVPKTNRTKAVSLSANEIMDYLFLALSVAACNAGAVWLLITAETGVAATASLRSC